MDETSGREKENEHKMVESNVQREWGRQKTNYRLQTTTEYDTILTQSMPPLITSLQQMNERTNERAFHVCMYTVHFHSKFDIKQAMKKWHCFAFSNFAMLSVDFSTKRKS